MFDNDSLPDHFGRNNSETVNEVISQIPEVDTYTQQSVTDEGSEVFVWGNDEHGQLGIGNIIGTAERRQNGFCIP